MGEVLSAFALMVAVLLVIAVFVGGMLMLTGGKLVERDPMDAAFGGRAAHSQFPHGLLSGHVVEHPLTKGDFGPLCEVSGFVVGKIEHAPEDH